MAEWLKEIYMAHQWKIKKSRKQIEQHMNNRVSRQIYDDFEMSAREYKIIILDPYLKEFKCKFNIWTICEKKRWVIAVFPLKQKTWTLDLLEAPRSNRHVDQAIWMFNGLLDLGLRWPPCFWSQRDKSSNIHFRKSTLNPFLKGHM